MVFQSFALFPHLTVERNIAFGLRARGEPTEAVTSTAEALGLADKLDRRPGELSGGERQRVALARALAARPRVLLLDEPLSNLDAQLRVQTRTQIAALQRRLGVTTVYVTHDQVEAMTMGDRVAVLDRGVLQQCASPKELFTDPVNRFVAGFIGSPQMNLLEATVSEAGATYGSMTVPLTPAQRSALSGATVTLGVRPEDWRMEAAGGLDVQVAVVEELGSEAFLYGTEPSRDVVTDKPIVARVEGLSGTRAGDVVHLVARPERVHVFDAGSGARV